MNNIEVGWFFEKKSKWQDAYTELRSILLDCGLKEVLKWGKPTYMYEEYNIVLIHGFKEYCALLFMQGALLHDEQNILVQQTPNVQAARQMRFKDVEEIKSLKPTIKSFVKEAIKNEKAGKKVELKKTDEYEMVKEFEEALDEMPDLKKAFYELTPGRQRGYLLYFSSAKQSKTRLQRIEKYIPKILDKKGLED